MECFLCERDATRECDRCGALYCDDHGDALCERCSDPDLAIPSHRLYRGALIALFAGSLFALWLLIRPPGDEPGLAASPVSPVVGPATIVLAPDPDEEPTPAATELPATATPSPTPTPEVTSTPSPTASPSATPSPTPTPTPAATASPTPAPTDESYIEYTVQDGDTLVAIVGDFLPDGGDFEEFAARIIEINDIEDSGSLSVGDVLLIPVE